IHDTSLPKHGERQQQQQCCAQVQQLQVEGYAAHPAHAAQAPSNRCTSRPRTANRKARARNSGARKTRSFADTVSISASAKPATASLTPSTGIEARRAAGPL